MPRVTLTGINGNLKVLSERENHAYLVAYLKDGDKSAREKLIMGNLRLVLSVVQRFANRCENLDDLFQVGCIGLMKGIDHFDLQHEVRFSTYAVPMILGEIRRYLRDNTALRVSRSLRDTAYHAMREKEAFINQYGREPKTAELAQRMGIPKENLVIALESVVDPISLNEPVYSEGGDTLYLADQIGDYSDDRDWQSEISFKSAVSNLSQREKRILYLRFMAGQTQTQVAGTVGISQAQVSRLEKSAVQKIKSEL